MSNQILQQLSGKTVSVAVLHVTTGVKMTTHHPPTTLVIDGAHGAAGDVIFRLDRVTFAQFNARQGWWDITVEQP